jgi:hypothetical protein
MNDQIIGPILKQVGQCRIVRAGDLAAITPTVVFACDIETFGTEDRTGDVAGYEGHGIAGISLCNMLGDAVYFACKTPYQEGLVITDVIDYLQKDWFVSTIEMPRTVVFHNAKFDLSFLMHEGLHIRSEVVKVVDTWVLSSILSRGQYSSNALKDLARREFNLNPGTQDVIKQWLAAQHTDDYGKVPLEIIAPYACDDVRYTLALFFKWHPVDDMDKKFHDLYVANAILLANAERRGILVHRERITRRIQARREQVVVAKTKVEQLLGTAKVDLEADDAQEIFRLRWPMSSMRGHGGFCGSFSRAVTQCAHAGSWRSHTRGFGRRFIRAFFRVVGLCGVVSRSWWKSFYWTMRCGRYLCRDRGIGLYACVSSI